MKKQEKEIRIATCHFCGSSASESYEAVFFKPGPYWRQYVRLESVSIPVCSDCGEFLLQERRGRRRIWFLTPLVFAIVAALIFFMLRFWMPDPVRLGFLAFLCGLTGAYLFAKLSLLLWVERRIDWDRMHKYDDRIEDHPNVQSLLKEGFRRFK